MEVSKRLYNNQKVYLTKQDRNISMLTVRVVNDNKTTFGFDEIHKCNPIFDYVSSSSSEDEEEPEPVPEPEPVIEPEPEPVPDVNKGAVF